MGKWGKERRRKNDCVTGEMNVNNNVLAFMQYAEVFSFFQRKNWHMKPYTVQWSLYGNQYRNYHIQGSANNHIGRHFKWIIIKSANENAEIWLLKL